MNEPRRTIIPYQELLGNYDASSAVLMSLSIIPYQELLGNYDLRTVLEAQRLIIPYQELLGNYDRNNAYGSAGIYYTIPRAIREL